MQGQYGNNSGNYQNSQNYRDLFNFNGRNMPSPSQNQPDMMRLKEMYQDL